MELLCIVFPYLTKCDLALCISRGKALLTNSRSTWYCGPVMPGVVLTPYLVCGAVMPGVVLTLYLVLGASDAWNRVNSLPGIAGQ